MQLRRFALLLGIAAGAVGCSSGTTVYTPHPTSSSAPGSGRTAAPATASPSTAPHTAAPSAASSATPQPGVSGQLSVTQAAAALQGVENYYLTLPHTDPVADVNNVAAAMTASGLFSSAVVSPGGITAIFPDGETAVVFADRLADLTSTGTSASSAARHPAVLTVGTPPPTPAPTAAPAVSAPDGHEIAFLVNTHDPNIPPPFVPQRQADFASAFKNLGFAQAGYGIDDLDISLENIDAVGANHPLDFLDIATHGAVIGKTNYSYVNLSTSPVNTAEKAKYAADYAAGRIVYAIYLTKVLFPNSHNVVLPTFAFTPDFLTLHLAFNPGAIVDNQSCLGQNPLIATLVQTKLQLAGIGRYLGWTKDVGGTDADETDAFILDRMLGESSPSVTGLDQYANQLTPPQRPFPLDDIEQAMSTETRFSPIQAPQNEPYTVSDVKDRLNLQFPPLSDGTKARLVVSDFGGESVANVPIVYGLPSIERMVVGEHSAAGILEIDGTFPAAEGSVTITTASGTSTPAPVSWTSSQIIVPIPNSGGALVQVATADGIASNQVPLTEWSGTLSYQENDSLHAVNGSSLQGSGSGMLTLNFSVKVRSDVHPTNVTIDTASAPQNLYFTDVEYGDSSGSAGTVSGSFSTGGSSVAFSSPANAPPILPNNATSSFGLHPVGGQPAPCSDASPGPQPGAGNVLCPTLTFFDSDAVSCTPSGSMDLCSNFGPAANGSFGNGAVSAGLLKLTMDLQTYALTVSSNSSSIDPTAFGSGNGTGKVTGSFAAPVNPPSAVTPAVRRGH